MAENYNKNSHNYKMPKLKDLLKGSGFEEIPEKIFSNEKGDMERNADELKEFADKRGDGAEKIVKNAKDSGGLSMLTYNHFKVKLPYYEKAAAGKFDMDKSREEYVTLLDQLYKSTIDGMKIDQKKFQELVGKIEVIGELCIKNKDN